MKTSQLSAIQMANFETEYSDSKFWNKVKALVKEAGYNVIYLALLLYYVLMSPDVPYQQKLLIIGALGYLICPIDLIPDFIPVVGYTDDLTALAGAVAAVKTNLTPEIEAQAKAKANSLFNM